MSIAQGLTPVLFALAAAQIAAEKRIVRQLRLAGATTAEHATEIHARSPLARWKLRRLLSVQAIATAVPDRYFLDEGAYDRWRQVRRRRAIAVVILLILIIAGAWAWGQISIF